MGQLTGRGQERKRQILENYHAVLAKEGLEGASINRLAAAMGINPSLVMHYFPSKEELVVALVEHILETYESTFLPGLRAIRDPEKRLNAAVDTLFGEDWAGLVDNGVFYACYSLGFRNRRVRESFRSMYARLRDILADEMSELMAQGVVAGSDPALLADLLITMMEGYDFYRAMMKDEERFQEYREFLKEKAMEMIRPRERTV